MEAGTAEQGIAISIRPLPPRKLGGLLSMPRCEVILAFHGYDDAACFAFLHHFDRVYQRGGG